MRVCVCEFAYVCVWVRAAVGEFIYMCVCICVRVCVCVRERAIRTGNCSGGRSAFERMQIIYKVLFLLENPLAALAR